MCNQKTWTVYDCDLVDMAETHPEAEGLPRAIAIHSERPLGEAEALPKGFVTKVLLDYDFSDDEQVLEFTRRYGLVTCPYDCAIGRTFMALEEPFGYRRLLDGIVRWRNGEEDLSRAGILDLLLRGWSIVQHGAEWGNDATGPGPADDFTGCDFWWDAKRLYYSGLNASDESWYLHENARGFVRKFGDDDKLVGTERLRAFSWNMAASQHSGDGEWVPPMCCVSIEEVRTVLYLLQAASVVLQGYSYVDATWRRPSDAGSGADDEEADATRRTERVFQLFIMGRPNVVKALCSLDATCLEDRTEGDDLHGVLDEAERQRVARVLGMAELANANDPRVLRLLGLRPAWRVWGRLREDLAVFTEACLTNGWNPEDHHLIEDEPLMIGDLRDGGPHFENRANRMTLQKAIAEQILSHLDTAIEWQKPDRRANASKDPAWHVCTECGALFMYRSTTDRLVMKGEGVPSRDRHSSAETCSNRCRQRKSRAKTQEV